MSELEPCPLCGKEGTIAETCPHYDRRLPSKYFPKCSNENCALFTPFADGELGDVYRDYATPEEATAAWNTRPLEDALRARVEALEAALDEIRLIAIGEIEIMSDRQKRWNGKELYQIAKKAEAALNGEVKE